ncbi:DUF4279 domain-containing protein [Dyella tabacisoli]|uniref:DUF4279 domain-containing protein n=1 Tax=Dyella tabacisoli TaxID=2282381 RepID=A0A369UGG3_9GAMM|nr:DUF4279 domain-containing protein [Dyella tabacisoli]RDD79822.1 DUF4279 domain-containing protein [Dyella tabacisoli]
MNAFRFKMSLRFFGTSFDPAELSKELGMQPVHMHKVGDQRTTPAGAELEGTYKASYCTFNIDRRDNDEDLHVTLNRVSADLSRHMALFNSIREKGDRVEFFVGWFSDGNTGDTLPFHLLRLLGEMKIDLALDVYGSD